MEPKTKEFIWGARLSKENKMVKWSGRQDGVLEQIILKMAVLGSGAAKGERNLVEVTSFDSEQKKKKVLICSLGIDKIECQSLGDLSLFPPANFTLIEGSGPVEVVASHIILDEDDLSDEDDDEEFEGSMEDLREKLKAKRVINGKANASKKSSKDEDEDDDEYEDMDDDDEDEDEEEIDEEEMKKAIKKMKAELIDEEAEDSDDEDDGEDDDEEKEEEKAPSTKKRKLTNGKSGAAKPKEAKLTSPGRIKKAPEPKTPKSQQPKKDTPKTPKSEKKTPAKPKFESIEDVKAAIKKFPGGKPRKQDKFGNWIENTFKVSDDSWKNELWNWHKKDIGL